MGAPPPVKIAKLPPTPSRQPAANEETAERQATPQTDSAKERAERLLGVALRKQARLENAGVKIWGKSPLKTSYPDVLAALARANRKFDKRDYPSSIGDFREAISLLDVLAASKDERFRRAISDGTASLTNEDSDQAAAMFQVALALRPGDDQATVGLERAEKLPQVLAKMDQGRQHEKSRNLDAALRSYTEAKTLDAAYDPARRSAARVAAIIDERDYRASISRALAALENNRFRDATRALDAAGGIRPKAPEIPEIRRRIRNARQLATLTALRSKAQSFGRNERWKEALEAYDAALSIDRSAGFAVRGKAQAKKFLRLHDQIELYLSQPDRLNSPEPLAHAELVLSAADAVDNAGRRLSSGRDRLRQQISHAKKPRPVLLRSDKMTAVTIYRVGRFGAFREKRLSLRPGSYTAVGSRTGYRDARVQFRVGRAETETIVLIKCTERI